jgi:tetratricopeptide (TPR) repeat protein
VKRSITILIALVLAAIAPAHQAYAGDAQPTKDQLDAAKKAFGEARELYDAGKLAEAVEKFKEAYKLSKKPLLLYNIGHTLDELGQKDKALFYYRKFLADSEKTAVQRKDVTKRVDEIEKENLEADLNGTTTAPSDTSHNTTVTPTKPPDEVKPPVKVKPAGTYTAADFQHQMIDSAPPGKPLDVTASIPEDAGWTVTLYYRGIGDTKWIAKTMKWRYRELVARIPGTKIGGSTIQYYIDVKDPAGTMVTRSGKSTSPNLVNVDASVAPRFYPDLTDDTEGTAATVVPQHNEVEEDPLSRKPQGQTTQPTGPVAVETPLEGPVDTNPNKYYKKKWIATGIAGGLLGAAVVTYILGSQQASNIEADRDSRMGNTCMAPPCFEFDGYDTDVEKAGKRYNSLHTLTALTGVIAGSVAGYFWYKEHKLKKARRAAAGGGGGGGPAPAAPAAPAHDEFSLVPAFGPGFAGAAAIGRF